VLTANTIVANVVTINTVVQLANLTQTQVAAITPNEGMMVYNYTYGNVQAYTSRLGRWGNVVLS
jgi:hypothetical protein